MAVRVCGRMFTVYALHGRLAAPMRFELLRRSEIVVRRTNVGLETVTDHHVYQVPTNIALWLCIFIRQTARIRNQLFEVFNRLYTAEGYTPIGDEGRYTIEAQHCCYLLII